jgi:hypothetical protein
MLLCDFVIAKSTLPIKAIKQQKYNSYINILHPLIAAPLIAMLCKNKKCIRETHVGKAAL